MFKNILIPTDGSKLSKKAAVQGVKLAKSLKAKVTAFYAAPPATPIIYGDGVPVGYADPGDHAKMIKRTAARHLDFVASEAKKARVRFEAVQVTSDFPEEDILKVAKKKKCDLIVMGTQGQSGLRGVFIGSVTRKVLDKSKIPVMVLR